MKKTDKVKIIGGNNEPMQPTFIGQYGIIKGFGSTYYVKGIQTKEVYVEFKNGGLHIFNDYHLEQMKPNKAKRSITRI